MLFRSNRRHIFFDHVLHAGHFIRRSNRIIGACRIGLLVLWHLLYQAPLVTMTIIPATRKHDRLVHRLADWMAERRRGLQRALAVVLALLAAVILVDGVWSLIGGHEPWLRQLIALR